jgi:hypothetical protein
MDVFQFGKLPKQMGHLKFNILACNSKPTLNIRANYHMAHERPPPEHDTAPLG